MYFPLFLDLSDKEILVIGAGQIASRRIRSLYGFAGHITVVAPDISEDIAETDDTKVTVLKRRFSDKDLAGKDLVLAATDDAGLNRHVCDLCRERGIPVNVCSDSELCDFQFPSIVESGAVVIGINASGRDHRLVKETRKRVEALFRDEQEQFHSRYQ